MRSTVAKSLWSRALEYSKSHKETNFKIIYRNLKKMWLATPRNLRYNLFK